MTPAQERAQERFLRGVEVETIKWIVSVAQDITDEIDGETEYKKRQLRKVSALLEGSLAMLGDIVEELYGEEADADASPASLARAA